MTDGIDEGKRRFLEQRLRNLLMDYFARISTESVLLKSQMEFRDTVAVYLFNEWDDLNFHGDPRRRDFPSPVYSEEEFNAILGYHAAWDSMVEADLMRLERLEEVFGRPQWPPVRDAAARALAVFELRGRDRKADK